MDPVDLVYAVVGVGALLAALLPRLLAGRPLSMPIAFLGLGMLIFALPIGLTPPDPLERDGLATRLTEIGLIVALTGAGLKLDRPVGLRRWASTWRLLAIAMPLTIAAVALLGWSLLGLLPAAALLLGAALAPTDPVLAADVQVGEPTDEEDSEDEVRFALTSEAGLNDGLAFPFTYAAIAIATAGLAPGGWLGEWLAVDVLYKIVVGCAAGAGIGWLLGRLFFRAANDNLRLAEHSEGFVALIMTFLAYGLTELVGGYGFLAVFACAVVVRGSERGSGYHQVLHDFIEQIERLLTIGLLLLLGGAIVGGLLGPLTWQGAVVGLALLLVVRPVAGWLALRGSSGSSSERVAIAFFGIRGVGSLYYLAYATTQAEIPGAEVLWAVTAFTIVVSVVLHGVTATPVMQWIDARREHRHAQQATSRAA